MKTIPHSPHRRVPGTPAVGCRHDGTVIAHPRASGRGPGISPARLSVAGVTHLSKAATVKAPSGEPEWA
jgi:hypothetical protein